MSDQAHKKEEVALKPESEESKKAAEARKKLAEKFASTNTRLGGKGTPKRKLKVVHHANTSTDKHTKEVIKKLQAQPLQDLVEVNLFQNDMKVLQFKNPEVFGNIPNQTFIVCGKPEEKNVRDNFGEFVSQLPPSQIAQLKQTVQNDFKGAEKAKAEEAPQLVNFEDESKK